MQVRYQAALRPEVTIISDRMRRLAAQDVEDGLDFLAKRGEIRLVRSSRAIVLGRLGDNFVEAVARAADSETLIVQEVANAPDQEDFVMLIVTTVAAPLDGL